MIDALVKTEVELGPPSRPASLRVGGFLIGLPIALGIWIPTHGLLFAIGGGMCIALIVGYTTMAVIATRRFATENNLALSALGRGELAKAHEVFSRWARTPHVLARAVARHNLGWTSMLEGQLEEAVAILEDAEEHYPKALVRIGMLPTTRIDIALCHALLGKLDAAERWYEKSEAPVKAPPRPSTPGMRAIVRAVIDCRKSRAGEAAVALEQAWTEHESVLTGETLRMMRVLRAFACALADGPRSQGLVERVLADMRPRYAGELGFLGGTWPEMAAFLASHRLDT
jgi:Tetratricopeptide repeat